jgi:hypothetical protein
VRQGGKSFFATANDGAGQTQAMDRTKQRAETDAPEARPDERARARAYLDLWERHVVQTALNGPPPVWIPASA